MAHIWKALIQDPKKAVDEHLNHILDDLLVQCGSRLWRSREASCLALADIIQGRKFDQVGSSFSNRQLKKFPVVSALGTASVNSSACMKLNSIS